MMSVTKSDAECTASAIMAAEPPNMPAANLIANSMALTMPPMMVTRYIDRARGFFLFCYVHMFSQCNATRHHPGLPSPQLAMGEIATCLMPQNYEKMPYNQDKNERKNGQAHLFLH